MKKADKFDPAKWLVENKITFQSRLNEIKNFDDNAKAYGILFVDNDDEDEIEETPYIWNEKAVEALVMSMGYEEEDIDDIAGTIMDFFPAGEDEMGIFRTQEGNPDLQPEDLTIGMYKKNIKNEFPNLNENTLDDAEQVMINGKEVDLGSLELDGVSPSDEISDAYARAAKFTDGTDLNDEEINEFNKNYIEIVQKMAIKKKSLN